MEVSLGATSRFCDFWRRRNSSSPTFGRSMRNWVVSAIIRRLRLTQNAALNAYQVALSNLDADGPQYIIQQHAR